MGTNSVRRCLALTLSVAAVIGAAACTSSGPSGDNSTTSTYTIWDPYPQYDSNSDWVKLLMTCGTGAGVTIARTGYDTTDLTNKVLLAAQQGTPPDVLIVDNPVISTLAEAGV